MWAVEIDLITVWGIELNLVSVSGWEGTWFLCVVLNLVFWIEIELVFVSGN